MFSTRFPFYFFILFCQTIIGAQEPFTYKVKELVNGHRLIAHCKLGGRSAKALNILKEAGIEGTNVKGGIAAWSQEIDSSIPQY